MEIEKYNNQANLIVKALNSPIIRKVEEPILRLVVSRAIAKAIADTGQSKEDTDIDYLIGTIPFEVQKQVPNIRLDEIPIAINNGIFGHYGKYFGINVLTIVSFCQHYLESESRKKEAQKLLIESTPTKPIPSPKEVQKSIKEAIVRAYKEFTEKGFYEDYGNFIYDKMDEMGLISLSTSRKLEIYNQAQVSINNKKRPQKSANRQQYKELTSMLVLVNDANSVLGQNIIKTEAKKIALQVVFSDFSEVETDINELVNQKQNF